MAATRPRALERPAAPPRLIAIGTSAGGLQALSVVLGALPADLGAAVAVVQHRLAGHDDGLVAILRNRAALRVRAAAAGGRLQAGVVEIAPPDAHLRIVAGGLLTLDQSARVEYVRPSASILFASAAAAFGSNLIAVVLTGRGGDGAVGVRAAKRAGGIVIAQDPRSAVAAGMPAAAIATGCVDRVVPLAEVAAVLIRLVQGASATV